MSSLEGGRQPRPWQELCAVLSHVYVGGGGGEERLQAGWGWGEEEQKPSGYRASEKMSG